MANTITRVPSRTDGDVEFGLMMGSILGFVSDPSGDLCVALDYTGELSGLADWSHQERAEEETGLSAQEIADEAGVVIFRLRPGEDTAERITD